MSTLCCLASHPALLTATLDLLRAPRAAADKVASPSVAASRSLFPRGNQTSPSEECGVQDPSSMQRKFITCFHATEQLGLSWPPSAHRRTLPPHADQTRCSHTDARTSLPPATAERHVYSDHPANLSAHTDFDVEVKGQRLPNAYWLNSLSVSVALLFPLCALHLLPIPRDNMFSINVALFQKLIFNADHIFGRQRHLVDCC